MFIPNYLYTMGTALCVLTGLAGCSSIALSKPFEWPGFDIKHKRLKGEQQKSVLVAITHAELDGAHRKAFDAASRRVLEHVNEQPGLVGYSVRTRLIGHEVWTVTVWTDEASLQAFARSSVHLQAMREGHEALRTMQYHRFELPVSELPLSWNRVLEELSLAEPARPASGR